MNCELLSSLRFGMGSEVAEGFGGYGDGAEVTETLSRGAVMWSSELY